MSELLKYPGESQNDNLSPEAKKAAHSRRRMLFKLAVFLNGAIGAVLAVPILGYVLGPALKKGSSDNSWIDLGPLTQFPPGETRLATYVTPVTSPSDGETSKIPCWVRCLGPGKFQVFAINCAHLGCPVHWFAQSGLFLCPCHGGAYYADGSRAAGPPERGLFEYKHKLNGDSLMISAGEMPTLATEACLKKPLIRIQPAASPRPESSWPA